MGRLTYILVLSAFCLPGCLHQWWADPEAGDYTAAEQQECIDNATTFNGMVNCVPAIEPPVAHGPVPVSNRITTEIREEPDPNSISGETRQVEYECQVGAYIERDNVAEIAAPALTDLEDDTQPAAVTINTLWPGALVQGDSIEPGTLLPVISNRKPVTVVLSNVIFDDSDAVYVKTVNNPTSDNLTAAVEELFNQGTNNVAAKIDYRIKTARSFDQVIIGVNAKARIDTFLFGSLKGEAGASSDYWHETNHVVINMKQAYFTLSFLTPETPVEVWDESQTLADLRAYITPNNPPGYVASVTYGRTANLIFSSDEDSLTLSAWAKATYTIPIINEDVTVASWRDSTNELWFDSDVHLQSPDPYAWELYKEHINDPDATRKNDIIEFMNEYLDWGATDSLTDTNYGIPISYQVRWLRNNEPARLSLAASYEESTCYPKESKPGRVKEATPTSTQRARLRSPRMAKEE